MSCPDALIPDACDRNTEQNNVFFLYYSGLLHRESIPLEGYRLVFLLSHCPGNTVLSGTPLGARHIQSLLPSVAVCSDQ